MEKENLFKGLDLSKPKTLDDIKREDPKYKEELGYKLAQALEYDKQIAEFKSQNVYFDKEYQFALWIIAVKDYWIDFKVIEVLPRYEDNKPVFQSFRDSEDWNNWEQLDHTKAEVICYGHIKSDRCMEIHELTYHFCGYTNILDRITKMIYKKAEELMPNFDKE